MNANAFLSALLAPAVVLTASAELTEIDTKITVFQSELLSATRLIVSLNAENADVTAVKLEKITSKLESLAPQISAEDYENMSEEGMAVYQSNLESLQKYLSSAQSGLDEKEFQRILQNNPRLYSAFVRFNQLNTQFANRVNQNRRESLEYLYADEIENFATEDKLILEVQKIGINVLVLLAEVNEKNADAVAGTLNQLTDRYEQIGAQLQPDDINEMGELAWMIYLKSIRDVILATANVQQNMPTYEQAMQISPALLQASIRWGQVSTKVNDRIYSKMNAERCAQRDRELQAIINSFN